MNMKWLMNELSGGKVTIILAEASLELVPREIASHPSVTRNALRRGKKPYETLLDKSLHYHAMSKLRMREKRGRPDIVHVSLLEILSSPLNLEGRLNVYVHTIGDYVISIKPETRIPRNYNRFVGLMEQLLIKGSVPPDSPTPLMVARPSTFKSLIKSLKVDGVVLLDESGELLSPKEICRVSVSNSLPIVIGAFPHGEFSEDVRAAAIHIYSIYRRPLEAWVVASRVITGCEELLNIIP